MRGIHETIIGFGAIALLAASLFAGPADAQEWRRGYRYDRVNRAYIQWQRPAPIYRAPVYVQPGYAPFSEVAGGLGQIAAAPFNLLGGLFGGTTLLAQPGYSGYDYSQNPCYYWTGAAWQRRC
jgi:hypothetical protein